MLPHRAEIGRYTVVLIADANGAARVDTVTTSPRTSPNASTADATAYGFLAAHIDGMAKRKSAEIPVIPVEGQLALFPLPGQIAEPAPATSRSARPVPETRRSGSVAWPRVR